MKVKPPALPCRDDVLVENGAAVPKSCLPPLEMRSPRAAGSLLPTGETSTATKTTFDYSTVWFCQTEETHSERTSTPSAWYDSGFREINCLLPPPAGGSSRQNRGKIGCSIQAVLKVVSAPARFWERGARCFVGRFALGLDEAAACFGGWMARVSTCRRAIGEPFTLSVLRSIVFSPLRLIQKGHAVEGGSRL